MESPVIPHLMNMDRGVLEGHDELQSLFENVASRKPDVRQYYRTGYLTDGKKLMFEYPRSSPSGEQMDFVDVMELNDDGLIQRHRVYWGWLGLQVIEKDTYHR